METGTEVRVSSPSGARASRLFRDPPAGRQRSSTLWLLGGFSIVYFACTGLLAWHKPLWYDELFTFHLCRLGRLSDLASALAGGTDLNPPLYYLAARGVQVVMGESPLALRLPAMVGFWVMSLCIFRFVSRRSTPLYGWIALAFPLAATFVYSYAYEARPYGLVLGFSGLALVCWQTAAAAADVGPASRAGPVIGQVRLGSPDLRQRRGPALAGLALSLAGAVCSHYYAVLLLFPVALGEMVRSLTRKRMDLAVWLALGAAVLPLGCMVPWLEQARTFASHFWAQPSWEALKPNYLQLMINVRAPLLVLAIILVFYPKRTIAEHESPLHEMAAAIGLAVLPILGMALGQFVTGAFTLRYVLPAVVGFAILISFVSFRRSRGSAPLGRILLLGLLGLFVVGGLREGKRLVDKSARLRERCAFLEHRTAAKEVLAVSNALLYLELVHHGSADLVSRLIYISDPEAASRYLRHDTSERALRHLRQWAALKVVDYGPFVAHHHHFLVYGSNGWLLSALKAEGVELEMRGQDRGDGLWAVHTRSKKGKRQTRGRESSIVVNDSRPLVLIGHNGR